MQHPLQPIYVDEHGTERFRGNAIIRWLCDTERLSLNQTAVLPGIADEDHRQLAQLLGYSICGYSELSYVDDVEWGRVHAAKLAAALPSTIQQSESGITDALHEVVSALLHLGFSETDVDTRPDWCIRQFVTTQRETDWRDAFMAALAGGETSSGAVAIADAAVEILQARRTKVGGA